MRILVIASNYGVWAEELQGPWDALREAGHELTLATYLGKTPLPGVISMDPEFVDPMQKVKMNPPELLARVNQILDTGEWDHPIRTRDADMAEYDALVIVGGAGSALDVAGSGLVHRLVLDAYKSGKTIGALCYAVGALRAHPRPGHVEGRPGAADDDERVVLGHVGVAGADRMVPLAGVEDLVHPGQQLGRVHLHLLHGVDELRVHADDAGQRGLAEVGGEGELVPGLAQGVPRPLQLLRPHPVVGRDDQDPHWTS
ncbi:hypothetical protein GCM10020218_106450 [Dactylosporangium vinaceum]